MIRERRVRDPGYVLFGHVAGGAIIRWVLLQALGCGKMAAVPLVTVQAPGPIVFRSLPSGGPRMRIMTGDAAEPAGARAVALAQRHGEVVLQQNGLRRRVAIER